jgi:hypothetical protein
LTWINATAARWRDASAMFPRTLCVVMSLFVVSCAADRTGTSPRTPVSDEAACASYGFVPGTTAYITCVQREIDARRSGKLGPTYDQRLIVTRG